MLSQSSEDYFLDKIEKQVYNRFIGPQRRYITIMPNAKERQKFNYHRWVLYLKNSTEKNLEYNEDYFKYLRGMCIIRDLEEYELDFMEAYNYVELGIGSFSSKLDRENK